MLGGPFTRGMCVDGTWAQAGAHTLGGAVIRTRGLYIRIRPRRGSIWVPGGWGGGLVLGAGWPFRGIRGVVEATGAAAAFSRARQMRPRWARGRGVTPALRALQVRGGLRRWPLDGPSGRGVTKVTIRFLFALRNGTGVFVQPFLREWSLLNPLVVRGFGDVRESVVRLFLGRGFGVSGL